MESYDLVVIGAGTGGLVAAFAADAMGARVLLIERARMGGECLWSGCVPSKTLIKSARVYDTVQRAAEFGVHLEKPRVIWNAIKLRIKDVQDDIKALERKSMADSNVEFCIGSARFIDEHTIEIDSSNQTRQIRARKVIIATGSSVSVPKIDGLEDSGFITHQQVFDLPAFPRRLAIIGGGPLGCEFAHAFARLGCQVTLLQHGGRVLDKEDDEVSAVALKILRAAKVEVLLNSRVQSVRADEDSKYLQVRCEGETRDIKASQLLLATGKKPNISALELENAGVKFSEQGMEVDEHLQTSVAHIFACGDVTGRDLFTHAAEHEAKIAVQNALLPLKAKAPAALPWTTFLDPEIARVGLSEAQARRKWHHVRVFRQEFKTLDRAIIEGETLGFCKIVTTGAGRIVGAHIVGASAGELIAPWTIAISEGALISEMGQAIFVYPTLSEISHRAGNDWYQQLLKNPLIHRTLKWWIQRA